MAINIDPKAIVQTITVEDDTFKFKTPFVMSVTGASMSGKSEFIVKLIQHREQMFNVKFDQIFYCEPENLVLRPNPIYEKIRVSFPDCRLVVGLPQISKLHLNIDTNHKLVVIDDLMESFLQSPEMVQLLSVDTHHFNISVIFTLQNVFAPSKFGKTLSRNVNYRCLFYNRLDLTEIRTLSSQMHQPPRFLIESFNFLRLHYPNEPPYIILDGHTHSPLNQLYVRSQIFPLPGSNEAKPIFFFPET